MIKPGQLSKISIAALVGSVIIVSNAQPASAGWFTKDEYLGRLTEKDNRQYWRYPTPPSDRNKLCLWRYGGSNVWGREVWSGFSNWQTDCYRWRWFWQ
ncbi:MAG: hypothetical protein HGA42_16100 [Nostocales cyanobacterium W4_Combined_metabat2_030]|nr:hypothetical protein [Nostocales cyanobacterium W4_Combined_metabat2_030]